LAHLGRVDEARRALEGSQRRAPDFSVATVKLPDSISDPADVERYLEGLGEAGLKE
jgi:hypothetical protein